MTALAIPPDLRDQRHLVWRHHRRRERSLAVVAFVCGGMALALSFAPLAFAAIVLGAFAAYHNGRRRNMEVRP